MMRARLLLLAASAWMVSGLLSAQAAKQAPTPAPTPAAPSEALPQTILEEDELANAGRAYTYDPAGRRDPFRSLLVRSENRAGGARPPGIAGIAVDDVIIQGIWKTKAGYLAQIRGTDNKSYLLKPGDLLYDGEVTRIGPNEVSFRQNLNDPQSVKPFRDVTKQLNATIKQ
jgi:type IV pilus assembly protein PilP